MFLKRYADWPCVIVKAHTHVPRFVPVYQWQPPTLVDFQTP